MPQIDPQLTVVIVLSTVVAFLGGVPVASRPAAVITRQVQLATAISFIFFIVTRLSNLFYLPILANFVDNKVKRGQVDQLYPAFQWIILACSVGTFFSWILLPNLVSLYCFLVNESSDAGVPRTLLRLANPKAWPQLTRHALTRYPLQARLFQLQGIPLGFLCSNILATAVWTIGALCAVYASAVVSEEFSSTAIMLSGLVNSVAAISMSMFVDPQAALLTDEATADPERPDKILRPLQHVTTAAWHLALGNFVGSLLGLALFTPGYLLIGRAANLLGHQGSTLFKSLWPLVLINVIITLLATTAYSSRISAVVTGARATALAVFNLFAMVARLTAQVLAPALAAIADTLASQGHVEQFVPVVRWVLAGASLGALSGLLLLPTFVEVYNQAIVQLQRQGSVVRVLLRCLHWRSWPTLFRCLKSPGLFGLNLKTFRELPTAFLWGNLLVIGIHTVGVPASIYAGKLVIKELARSATQLSSLVNGFATITLGILVDPTAASITDRVLDGRRPREQIYAMAVLLAVTLLGGTLLSQLIFLPATDFIGKGAELLNQAFPAGGH